MAETTTLPYRDCIRLNMFKLLEEVEPDLRLKGCLIEFKVLNMVSINKLWCYKNPVELVKNLLTMVLQYNDEILERFCDALRHCGQSNVIKYLTSVYIAESEEGEIRKSPDFYELLNEETKEIFRRNWNFIIDNLNTDDCFLDMARDISMMTKLEVKKLKGEVNQDQRNNDLLNLIWKRTMGHYKQFISLLEKTDQHDVLKRLSVPL